MVALGLDRDKTAAMAGAFARLMGFESRQLIEACFTGLHQRELNAGKARAIMASFRQGRMLFESAASTQTLARPITQSYGVSAISRGLATVLRWDGSAESLSRGHGLTMPSFADDTKSLTVQVTIGLFNDLTVATEGATLRVRTAAPDWFVPYPSIDQGTTLAVAEVAQLLPVLAREVRQWTQIEPPTSFALEACDYAGDQSELRWKFSGSGSEEELRKQFGASAATVESTFVVASTDYEPQLAQGFVFVKVGHLVLREPLSGAVRLSPLQAMFVISYALSMLARYRPSHWMEILSGVGSDSMFPFVEAYLDFAQIWFPELAADHLQFVARCDYSMIPNTSKR